MTWRKHNPSWRPPHELHQTTRASIMQRQAARPAAPRSASTSSAAAGNHAACCRGRRNVARYHSLTHAAALHAHHARHALTQAHAPLFQSRRSRHIPHHRTDGLCHAQLQQLCGTADVGPWARYDLSARSTPSTLTGARSGPAPPRSIGCVGRNARWMPPMVVAARHRRPARSAWGNHRRRGTALQSTTTEHAEARWGPSNTSKSRIRRVTDAAVSLPNRAAGFSQPTRPRSPDRPRVATHRQ